MYHDDIMIFAENADSLSKRIRAVKTRLNEKKVTINEAKSTYYSDEITYLGFRVSARGIEPDGELVNKINSIDKTEVQGRCRSLRWLGELLWTARAQICRLDGTTESAEEIEYQVHVECGVFPCV